MLLTKSTIARDAVVHSSRRRTLTAYLKPTSSSRETRAEKVDRTFYSEQILSCSLEGVVMVAANRIRCTVVAVEVSPDRFTSRGVVKDLVPWADPYVAQLIRNLQDEVRAERKMQAAIRHYRPTGVARLTTSGRISAAK
jgi:hypothetical protein